MVKEEETIWKILNDFRMKKFITDDRAMIKLLDYDKMLTKIQKILNK